MNPDEKQNQANDLAIKISPPLMDQLKIAGPESTQALKIIINLDQSVEWSEGLQLLKEAGLEITSQEKVILAVFGKATPGLIWRIAAIPAVSLIELEQQATIMR